MGKMMVAGQTIRQIQSVHDPERNTVCEGPSFVSPVAEEVQTFVEIGRCGAHDAHIAMISKEVYEICECLFVSFARQRIPKFE